MKKYTQDGGLTYAEVSTTRQQGLGPDSAGQSGDTQGLSDTAEAGPDSVLELVENGQYFEADAISGVEEAEDADVSEVRTREMNADDVPREYDGIAD